jgi:hypothetical protein
MQPAALIRPAAAQQPGCAQVAAHLRGEDCPPRPRAMGWAMPRLQAMGWAIPQLQAIGWAMPRLQAMGWATPQLRALGWAMPRLQAMGWAMPQLQDLRPRHEREKGCQWAAHRLQLPTTAGSCNARVCAHCESAFLPGVLDQCWWHKNAILRRDSLAEGDTETSTIATGEELLGAGDGDGLPGGMLMLGACSGNTNKSRRE